jgi:arginine N-succinyltransferase
MFVIRQAMPDDLSTLLKLAKMVHFLNLPADRDLIAAKIARSRRSFAGQEANEREREFMFVLEDADTGSVVGTCCAIGRVGWPGWPHVFLQVRRREHWSSDLQQGITHVTVEFGTEESGFSEVGGLILAPGYRGHKERLGSLLSLVRFHFLGMHRAHFQDRILAELMGPLTPDSQTLFWEFFGRRFINLSYKEADAFCQHSKEFMVSLLPKEEIYASTLPPEARNLIGKVGEETVPAKVLLERQGFKATDHVDPFDGGPYLAAQRDEIAAMLEQSGGGGPDTFSNANNRFSNVNKEARDYARLGALSSVSTTSDELVREQFDLAGAADITQKKNLLAGQERARFGGSSGLTAKSLSAGRRAQ